jgi:hypothetical protein
MRRPRSKRMGVERGQRPYKGQSPVLGPRPTRLQGYSSSTKVTSRLTLYPAMLPSSIMTF